MSQTTSAGEAAPSATRDMTPVKAAELPSHAEFFPKKPLWTPEIERKVQLVAEWVACDLPGSHIWGIQRIGKSEFAKYVADVLPALLGGAIVPFLWSFLGIKPRKPEDLLRACLVQTGCRAISARERSTLQLRIIDAVISRCQAAGAYRCLLIIDEMQNIPSELYMVVMSITSDLQREGLYPHVLSIGQPEMQQTIALMYQNHQLQTIGRFFPRTEIYYGLSTEDISMLLKNMDGPRLEFTSRWLPRRAAQGWSVKELGAPIENAISLMLAERNLTAVPRIPFGYLRPALNYMFRCLADDETLQLDEKIALDGFRFSGLPPVIGNYVASPGPQ